MGAGFDFLGDIAKQLSQFGEQLKDPNKPLLEGKTLMKWIGAQGVAVSQKAFVDQKLGSIQWPARYEGQEDPKFNFAGALMDWKSGRKSPKPNRFQDRPALVDEGMRGGLWGSLTFNVTSNVSVKWGSAKPYAQLHQEGGYTSIPFDKATKERIMDWLYSKPPKKGKVVKVKYRKGTVKTGAGEKRQRSEYAKHVKTLIRSYPLWDQKVMARPFVGITPQLEKDIQASVKMYFDRFQDRK